MTNEQIIQAIFTLTPEKKQLVEDVIQGVRLAGDMRIITIAEAARQLGCSHATVRRLIDDGKLENAPGPTGKRRVTARSLTAHFNTIAGKPHNPMPEPEKALTAKRKNKKCKK